MASVIHKDTTRRRRDMHLEAAGSFGVITGTASDKAKTKREMQSPKMRTAGNRSSVVVCCSVANLSHSNSLSRLTKLVTTSIS